MIAMTKLFFRAADGVHEVLMDPVDAMLAAVKHPHEWSLDGTFSEPPEGWQPSEGDGGGRGRVQGASVRAD
jgi:hypothetical protein